MPRQPMKPASDANCLSTLCRRMGWVGAVGKCMGTCSLRRPTDSHVARFSPSAPVAPERGLR
eukprot:6540839-Prymnesium_polylepis.1